MPPGFPEAAGHDDVPRDGGRSGGPSHRSGHGNGGRGKEGVRPRPGRRLCGVQRPLGCVDPAPFRVAEASLLPCGVQRSRRAGEPAATGPAVARGRSAEVLIGRGPAQPLAGRRGCRVLGHGSGPPWSSRIRGAGIRYDGRPGCFRNGLVAAPARARCEGGGRVLRAQPASGDSPEWAVPTRGLSPRHTPRHTPGRILGDSPGRAVPAHSPSRCRTTPRHTSSGRPTPRLDGPRSRAWRCGPPGRSASPGPPGAGRRIRSGCCRSRGGR